MSCSISENAFDVTSFAQIRHFLRDFCLLFVTTIFLIYVHKLAFPTPCSCTSRVCPTVAGTRLPPSAFSPITPWRLYFNLIFSSITFHFFAVLSSSLTIFVEFHGDLSLGNKEAKLPALLPVPGWVSWAVTHHWPTLKEVTWLATDEDRPLLFK